MSVFGVTLVHFFPHSGWIRRDTFGRLLLFLTTLTPRFYDFLIRRSWHHCLVFKINPSLLVNFPTPVSRTKVICPGFWIPCHKFGLPRLRSRILGPGLWYFFKKNGTIALFASLYLHCFTYNIFEFILKIISVIV